MGTPGTRKRAWAAVRGRRTTSYLLAITTAAVVVLGAVRAVTAPPAQGKSRPISAVDTRLILRPRTVVRGAIIGHLQARLAASPLIPGSNRLAVSILDGAAPLTGARVDIVATMTGMPMRPIVLTARPVRPGGYLATGELPMFGTWQLTVHIERRGAAPAWHRFTVSLNLPAGLLAPSGAPGTTH